MKYRILALSALVAVAMGACGNDAGPGPAGPVGPQGQPGPQGDVGPGDDIGPSDDIGPQVAGEKIRGSGDVVVESRDVSGFDRIDLAGQGYVQVVRSDEYSLTIETDDNLMDHLDVVVVGSTLTMRTAGAVNIDPTESIEWRIETPTLVAVALSGAGAIEAPGLSGDRIEVTINGVGEVSVRGLEATHLSAAMNGTGAIVASGVADSVDLAVNGAGDIDAGELESGTAVVAVNGAGSITLWATDHVDVSGTGLGTVAAYGSPEISGDVSRVTALGER